MALIEIICFIAILLKSFSFSPRMTFFFYNNLEIFTCTQIAE